MIKYVTAYGACLEKAAAEAELTSNLIGTVQESLQ